MTYVLTAEQLADLQADLGIGDDESTFTDAELQRIYDRQSGSYALSVIMALDQLTMQAARFYNYTVGQTKVERKQTFDNLRAILKDKKAEAGVSGGSLSTGVMRLGLDAPDPSTIEYDTSYRDYE